MRKRVPALLLLAVLLIIQAASALASVPYRTFTLGVDGNLVQTQAAYEPIRTMTRFGETTLKNPADMRLGPDGNLYIADDGNTRILVITQSGEFVKIIGSKKTLKSARGVFVDDNLNVFVADEVGALPSPYAIEAMRSGQLNIKNKIGFIISTKYNTSDNPFEAEVDYVKRVLNDMLEDSLGERDTNIIFDYYWGKAENIKELSIKYGITSERCRQIIRSVEFLSYSDIHKLKIDLM